MTEKTETATGDRRAYYAQAGGKGVLFPDRPLARDLVAQFGAGVRLDLPVTTIDYRADEADGLAAALEAVHWDPETRTVEMTPEPVEE